MALIDLKDFTVDLRARTVTHKSGAYFVFRRYETDAEFIESIPPVSTPDRFPGSIDDLTIAAKRAAIDADMKHC